MARHELSWTLKCDGFQSRSFERTAAVGALVVKGVLGGETN